MREIKLIILGWPGVGVALGRGTSHPVLYAGLFSFRLKVIP